MCLALPDAWEKVSHGEPTFWVGKKMFASFANAANHHGAGRHAVWCKVTHVTQDLRSRVLLSEYFRPPYFGPSGWIGSTSTAIPIGAMSRSDSGMPTNWRRLAPRALRRCANPQRGIFVFLGVRRHSSGSRGRLVSRPQFTIARRRSLSA